MALQSPTIGCLISYNGISTIRFILVLPHKFVNSISYPHLYMKDLKHILVFLSMRVPVYHTYTRVDSAGIKI